MSALKKVLFVAAALFVAMTLVSVAISATIPPDIKKVVTFIFLADDQGQLKIDSNTHSPIPYGTGFFVGIKDAAGNGLYGYIVTAKHVLKDQKGAFFDRIYLRINKLSGDAQYVPFDLNRNGQSLIFTHADPTVDIAVVPALPNQTIFDFKVISEDMLTTEELFSEASNRRGLGGIFCRSAGSIFW